MISCGMQGTPEVEVKDPRRPRLHEAIAQVKIPVEVEVARLSTEGNYIGPILPRDVTFLNLNDNITHPVLEDMCRPFGEIELSEVFRFENRHMGIGRLVFRSSRAARTCIEKINLSSRMGVHRPGRI